MIFNWEWVQNEDIYTLSGCIGKVVASHAAVARFVPIEVALINTMHEALREVLLPMRVGGETSQLDLPSLTPLSVAACGSLQLGVPHWAASVHYCKSLIIDPTFCGSRFSTGRLLAIEDFFLHWFWQCMRGEQPRHLLFSKNQRHYWEEVLSYSHSRKPNLPVTHSSPFSKWLIILLFLILSCKNHGVRAGLWILLVEAVTLPSQLLYPHHSFCIVNIRRFMVLLNLIFYACRSHTHMHHVSELLVPRFGGPVLLCRGMMPQRKICKIGILSISPTQIWVWLLQIACFCGLWCDTELLSDQSLLQPLPRWPNFLLFTNINGCRAGWGCVLFFHVCGWFEWSSPGVVRFYDQESSWCCRLWLRNYVSLRSVVCQPDPCTWCSLDLKKNFFFFC